MINDDNPELMQEIIPAQQRHLKDAQKHHAFKNIREAHIMH